MNPLALAWLFLNLVLDGALVVYLFRFFRTGDS